MTTNKQTFTGSITELFEAFNQLNVLIVGDVMLDRYWTGSVERISPEAPVPVVSLQDSDSRLGGAANVALNVYALGATPFLCSLIGEDEAGETMKQLLIVEGIDAAYLVTSDKRRTTLKTRVLANHQQMLRIDEEDIGDISEQETKKLLATIQTILDTHKIDVVLFQDYNKGVLSETVIRAVNLEARKRAIPTVVDPKANNFWLYKQVTLFKPNLKEIKAQIPFDLELSEVFLQKATQYIHSKIANTISLITLSDKGLFIDNREECLFLPTKIRPIADVCGAGDAVISIVSLALALNVELRVLAELANNAGGQVCERVGVVAIDKRRLLEELTAPS